MDYDDLASMAQDPALREAVLYELEMLHPLPPRPILWPRHPLTRVYTETEPLPASPDTEGPRIVDADPPPPMAKGHPKAVWGVALLTIFVLASLFIGNTVPRQTQVVATGCANYTVICKPSISAQEIDKVLTFYHSPAAGKGQSLYDLGVKYGVDPAFPLAFFMNESTFGTQGMARTTLALGNERCLPDRPCVNKQGLPCQAHQSCYAQFSSWEDGFEHWYQLITGPLYKGAGLTTVATIIPRYAPGSDHNDEKHYIAVVEQEVDAWRGGKV